MKYQGKINKKVNTNLTLKSFAKRNFKLNRPNWSLI